MRPLLLLLLTGAFLLTTSCRFERRPDAGSDSGTGGDTVVRGTDDGALGDSVRAVVRAYHEALRVGDGSRVASLAVPGATLVDQEEGVEWRLGAGAGAGRRLPSPLGDEVTGLGWERTSSRFFAWGDAALLVDRYLATVSGEDVPWTAVETVVLQRAPDGWLIRHVHRSRGGPVEIGGPPGPQPDGEV